MKRRAMVAGPGTACRLGFGAAEAAGGGAAAAAGCCGRCPRDAPGVKGMMPGGGVSGVRRHTYKPGAGDKPIWPTRAKVSRSH
eukprot:15447679-Alexandrium_andersonii.AAC.1